MKNNLASILNYQLPEFIREDHQVFVAFLQAYFEHLEETGQIVDFLHRFSDNLDIHQADENFIEAFYTELAGTFKKDPLIEKKRVINHIKDFYLAKGAEQSFNFIFTILFGEDVEINYPRIYMAKPSAGIYKSENIVYTTADNLGSVVFDNETLTSSLEGVTSGAMAIVDTIEPVVQNEDVLYRIKLSSYDKEFTIGEDVKIIIDNSTIYETVLPSINGVDITNAGTNYSTDDVITITNTISSPGDPDYRNGDYARLVIDKVSKGGYTTFYRDGDPTHEIGASYPTGTNYAVGDLIYADPVPGSYGHSFSAEVASVDGGGAITGIRIYNSGYNYTGKTTATVESATGSAADITLDGDIGAIESILVLDSGYNYPQSDTVMTVSGGDGEFTGSLVYSSIYRQPEKYLSIRNHPSSVSKLQDSFYYQQFSYTVGTFVKPGEYYDMIINNVHPVGAQMFPLWKVEDFKDISVSLAINHNPFVKTLTSLGSDAGSSLNIGILESNVANELGDWSTHYNFKTEIIKVHPELSCNMGNSYWDLDRTKFWTSFEYPMGTFKDVKFEDFLYENCFIYNIIEEQPETDITIT